MTERNLAIVAAVKEVAAELGRTPAQVGLAWTLHRPGVTTPVIGARTVEQLRGRTWERSRSTSPRPSRRARTRSARSTSAPPRHARQ
ncbi:aldo/keto reductase [Streptomyces pyxinicus]|uniref:aldo/keto reductase n=1 Tax=Streptomyces pyxinicus TaxID=2970331 RepID=UPI003D17D03F